MALEIIKLKRGDTWNPTISLFSDKKKTVSYDATGLTLKCYIKDKPLETAPNILTLDGSWSDQPNGVGSVTVTHVQSLTLMVGEYYFQFKVYTTADNAIVKTPKEGILQIVEAYEKDIS